MNIFLNFQDGFFTVFAGAHGCVMLYTTSRNHRIKAT
jgi:hypothetical protein